MSIFLVTGVVFLATLIRSIFGFGEALVAVPLLAFLIPVEVAVPLATLVSITVAGVVVLQDWRHIQIRSATRLVIFTLLGIPLGLWLLTSAPESIVKGLLGVLICGFSLYCLLRRHRLELASDRWAGCFGFIAGILGGAYGMNGPPLVVFGSLRGWSPEKFRATLQGYFLPASFLGMTGFWISGLWTCQVSEYYLYSLPATALAIYLGRVVNRRIHPQLFQKYVHLGLVGIGIVLFLQSFQSRFLSP